MKREAGFTLIEMLVALALTSMIAVAGSTLLISTLRASERLGQETRAVNTVDIAHTLMRDDFGNALTAAGRFTRPVATSQAFLAFVRDGWNHPDPEIARSSLLAVEYRFEDGTLTRRTWLRPDPVSATPYVDRDLATGLTRLSARYFTGKEWLDEWSSDDGTLPRMVELRLDFADNDTLTELFIVGGGG